MRTDYLNPELYNRLYTIMTYPNVLALRICLETGLRIDDALSLKPEQLRGRTLRGVAEKTGKPYKKTISCDLSKRLTQYMGKNYIFPHRLDEKRHRTRQAVWSNMKTAAQALGVELNAAPHSTRKTYAVERLHDVGLEQTRKDLQHDRISTTMIYAFSNMLNATSVTNATDDNKLEYLAELIACKVVEKLKKEP